MSKQDAIYDRIGPLASCVTDILTTKISRAERDAELIKPIYAPKLEDICENCQRAYTLGWDLYRIACQEALAPELLCRNIKVETKHIAQEQENKDTKHRYLISDHFVKVFIHNMDEYLINAHIGSFYRTDKHSERCPIPEVMIDTPLRIGIAGWALYVNQQIRLRTQATLRTLASRGCTVVDFIRNRQYENIRTTTFLGKTRPPPPILGYIRTSAQLNETSEGSTAHQQDEASQTDDQSAMIVDPPEGTQPRIDEPQRLARNRKELFTED